MTFVMMFGIATDILNVVIIILDFHGYFGLFNGVH